METDWSPFTFTMNWRFTRPHTPVRFEAMEPFCFVFPVQRAAIETFKPRLAPIEEDPALLDRFKDWSRGRDAFQERMRREPPATPAEFRVFPISCATVRPGLPSLDSSARIISGISCSPGCPFISFGSGTFR